MVSYTLCQFIASLNPWPFCRRCCALSFIWHDNKWFRRVNNTWRTIVVSNCCVLSCQLEQGEATVRGMYSLTQSWPWWANKIWVFLSLVRFVCLSFPLWSTFRIDNCVCVCAYDGNKNLSRVRAGPDSCCWRQIVDQSESNVSHSRRPDKMSILFLLGRHVAVVSSLSVCPLWDMSPVILYVCLFISLFEE